MPALTHTEACPEHIAHTFSVPMQDWFTASAAIILSLTQTIDILDIPAILQEWFSHDGSKSFELVFVDHYGTEHVITYTA